MTKAIKQYNLSRVENGIVYFFKVKKIKKVKRVEKKPKFTMKSFVINQLRLRIK